MSALRHTAIVAHPDSAICDSIARLLNKAKGWRVHQASNGGEAVRIALAALPQAVLVDPDLQGMNGVATIAALRAHGITCPVFALVQSGDSYEEWEAQGYAGTFNVSKESCQIAPQLRALLDPPIC